MSISAGGYVRSVAHEMGQELGCGAHLSRLRRTQAGAFYAGRGAHAGGAGGAGREPGGAGGAVRASAQPAAGDAVGDRRCAWRWGGCAMGRRPICRSFRRRRW